MAVAVRPNAVRLHSELGCVLMHITFFNQVCCICRKLCFILMSGVYQIQMASSLMLGIMIIRMELLVGKVGEFWLNFRYEYMSIEAIIG